MAKNRRDSITKQLTSRFLVLGLMAAAMWSLWLLHEFAPQGYSLNHLAIRPQSILGLVGIPLAPFLHGDLAHLAANTAPFLVLGGLVLMRSWNDFLFVTLFTVAGSGGGTWYFGASDTLHLGASGLIFGYFGFLLARGLFERTLVSLAIAAGVGFFYSGLIWTVFPDQEGVSWQAHCFGFLSGLMCAYFVARKRRR